MDLVLCSSWERYRSRLVIQKNVKVKNSVISQKIKIIVESKDYKSGAHLQKMVCPHNFY